MKKLSICLLALFAAVQLRAQVSTEVAGAQPGERSEAGDTARREWLTGFATVEVAGPFAIRFVRVADDEAPRIEFDTRGCTRSRFRAEVRDRVLRITERDVAGRDMQTAVTLYYNRLDAVSVSDAGAEFADTLRGTLFDLTVGGTASVAATFDVGDLRVVLSGRSEAVLEGSARYLTAAVSTGTLTACGLATTAVAVEVSNSGRAEVRPTDRLEAVVATGGKVTYRGAPEIVRTRTGFMGGTIERTEE
jgi:hypothetical protein